MQLELLVPFSKQVSEANNNDHHFIKSKRRNIIKSGIRRAWNDKGIKVSVPCEVTLTRIGHREMDFDNYVYYLKPARDCVADLILPGLKAGRADGDKRIVWHYKHEIGTYAIRIQITQKESSDG